MQASEAEEMTMPTANASDNFDTTPKQQNYSYTTSVLSKLSPTASKDFKNLLSSGKNNGTVCTLKIQATVYTIIIIL